MNLQTLRFFIAISDAGSFSSASEQLHYAQSNLSSRIKTLEDELGEALFYREKRGVTLTPKGEVLYDYAKKMLFLEEEAKTAVADDEHAKGRLSLGSIEAFASYELPGILASYHNLYPDVQLSLQVGLNDIFENMILSHTLDGAFIAGPVYDAALDHVHVKQEKMVFVASLSNSAKSLNELISSCSVITFPEGSAFRNHLEVFLRKKGIDGHKIPVVTINSLAAMIASICAGIGCGYLPLSIMGRYERESLVRVFTDEEAMTDLDIIFAFRKNRIRDAAFRYFVDNIPNLK